MAKFSKFDRVEFTYDGETVYGVVTRGGTKPTVIGDGAVSEYRVPEAVLKHSDRPLPKDDPHPMDSWGIKQYKEYRELSEETVAFSAIITRNGVEVMHAKNDGHGGCNMYWPVGGDHTLVTRLESDARQWLIDHGMPEESCFECSDMWLGWKAAEAPFGVTARAMIQKYQQSMDELTSGSGFKP